MFPFQVTSYKAQDMFVGENLCGVRGSKDFGLNFSARPSENAGLARLYGQRNLVF